MSRKCREILEVTDLLRMMLQQLHLCFLLAMLLSFCPRTCRAFANEEEDIYVSADWQRTVYTNDNTENAVQVITFQTGIKNRQSDSNSKTIVATHSAGINIRRGDKFTITKLEVSYSFTHKTETEIMNENEIYSSRTIQTTVTIPPRSTLTRWELILNVAGAHIGYSHYIDTLNDTHSTPQTLMIHGKAIVRRRINYGHTRIRIKHSERNEYVTVIRSSNWPSATLGHSNRYLFILCEDSRGLRIKTLNTTHPGYVWAYSSINSLVYFDWHREMGRSSDRNVNKQHWTISRDEPHYDGDVVTFMNKYYDDSGMTYHQYVTPNVHCHIGGEDRWVLETVDAADFPIDNCN